MADIYLSKDWTLGRAIGVIRKLTDEVAPGEFTNEDLYDFIHLAILEVAELLNEASIPDYGKKETVTQSSHVIDISGYRIDTITKLVDATNGKAIETTANNFEDHPDNPTDQDNIFWYAYGENIYLYSGKNVSAYGTLSLHFNSIPTKVTDEADTLDVKDKHIRLVFAKTKGFVYESKKVLPPESLTSLIDNLIGKIRGAKPVEDAIAKA